MTTTCTGEGRVKPVACDDSGLVHPLSPQLGTSFKGVGPHWHQLSPNNLAGASCASISGIGPREDPRLEEWQYAVISVRTEPRCERVVIAYPDEKSLRDLLAASSILGFGYSSREEAQLNIDCYTTTAHPSRREVTATPVTTALSLRRFIANRDLPRGESDLARAWSIICELVQLCFAVAIAAYYSKNVLSAAARALISF